MVNDGLKRGFPAALKLPILVLRHIWPKPKIGVLPAQVSRARGEGDWRVEDRTKEHAHRHGRRSRVHGLPDIQDRAFFIVRVEEALDTPRSRTTDPLSPLSFAPGIDKPLLLPR